MPEPTDGGDVIRAYKKVVQDKIKRVQDTRYSGNHHSNNIFQRGMKRAYEQVLEDLDVVAAQF